MTALDRHAPFVAQQAEAARVEDSANRSLAVCADMRAAPFASRVVRSRVVRGGALQHWVPTRVSTACLRLAKPGGYVAATEAVWIVPDPPDEIRRWWKAQYPDIASIEEKAASSRGRDSTSSATSRCRAPPGADHYYAPIGRGWPSSGPHGPTMRPGLEVIAELDTEIAMFERWGHTYSYEFFVGRRPPR